MAPQNLQFRLGRATQLMIVASSPSDQQRLEEHVRNFHIACPSTPLPRLHHQRAFAVADQNKILDILQSEQCQQAIHAYQQQRKQIFLLVGTPSPNIHLAAATLKLQVLANPYSLCQKFENKVSFRHLAAQRLPLPRFQIASVSQLQPDRAIYAALTAQFGPFVVQDSVMSGGKGSFVIRTYADYVRAGTYLRHASTGQVVISEFIAGDVMSVQGCVTRHGVFYGPLQRQLVGDPALVNPTLLGTKMFCGGQWGYSHYSHRTINELQDSLATAGEMLQAQGYTGIFGIDLIISPTGRVYILEINARLTGLTPILSMLQSTQPGASLLLLHILELSGTPYSVQNLPTLQAQLAQSQPASYLILHNRQPVPLRRRTPLQPGVYTYMSKQLQFVRAGYHYHHLKAPSEFIVYDIAPRHAIIKPGQRLVRVLTRQNALDVHDRVSDRWAQLVAAIEASFTVV